MTLNDFLAYAATGKPLNTPEICSFMDEMSNEARRVTFRLNAEFHTQEEVRALLSEIMGYSVPDTLRVFPPFYTDFGKNIHIGENVFINACCHFQDHGGVTLGDGCQIGHNVVFATLNHGIEPENRRFTYPAPIVLGTQRVGWFQFDNTPGRYDRRQFGGRCRRRGNKGCACRHDSGRRSGARDKAYLTL